MIDSGRTIAEVFRKPGIKEAQCRRIDAVAIAAGQPLCATESTDWPGCASRSPSRRVATWLSFDPIIKSHNWCVGARTEGRQRSRWSGVSAGALPDGLQGFPGAHDAF